jgi:hypothetical protein
MLALVITVITIIILSSTFLHGTYTLKESSVPMSDTLMENITFRQLRQRYPEFEMPVFETFNRAHIAKNITCDSIKVDIFL